jgi:carboxymethylenebutenolidase
VVVIQEIFGVNSHIRDVCDQMAKNGFDAIAPALFDRVEAGVELDYVEEDIEQGRRLAASVGWDQPVLDIDAAANAIAPGAKPAAVGFCWGASWTWVAAARLELGCAVCYYGRHIPDLLDQRPQCPVMLHFGAQDASIPMANVDRVRTAYPEVPIHVYEDAGHGFNCDRRNDFRPQSAELAMQRTLAFFVERL